MTSNIAQGLDQRVAQALEAKAENDARTDGKYTAHFHSNADLIADLYAALQDSQKAGKDAERYRWLRDNSTRWESNITGKWQKEIQFDAPPEVELDQAIDAAMTPSPTAEDKK